MLKPDFLSEKRYPTKAYKDNCFYTDTDLLFFFPPWRRLQDKTQVESKTDYARTRLTHSLEVAAAARQLAYLVHENINCSLDSRQLGDVLFAAGIAHDLGTPPFGHNGENVISAWFKNSPTGKKFHPHISKSSFADYSNFDANSFTFRLLVSKQNCYCSLDKGISLATLLTFMKYPCSANFRSKDYIGQSKAGILQTELKIFTQIANEINLPQLTQESWQRSPFVFLLEAADDICYYIADLEDAYTLKKIDYEKIKHLLFSLCSLSEFQLKEFQSLSSKKHKIIYLAKEARETLLKKTAAYFSSNYAKIATKNFNQHLFSCLDCSESLKAIRELSRKELYSPVSKNEKEQKIISKLMTGYGEALLTANEEDPVYQDIIKFARLIPADHEAKLVVLFDYIFGMTDKYAINKKNWLKNPQAYNLFKIKNFALKSYKEMLEC